MDDLPICKTCIYASNLKNCHNRVELDCAKNPNLGAVGKNYCRCPSYCKVRI